MASSTALTSARRAAGRSREERHGRRPATEDGAVAELLADAGTGLPDPATMVVREYSPRLSLERIGQPYVSSGGGASGTFVRGGGSLLFGDMLGERSFRAAVQIGNRLHDAAFAVRDPEPGSALELGRRRRARTLAAPLPAQRNDRANGQPAVLKEADYLQRMQLAAAGSSHIRSAAASESNSRAGFVARVSSRTTVAGRIRRNGTRPRGNEGDEPGGAPTTVTEFGTAWSATPRVRPNRTARGVALSPRGGAGLRQLSYLRVLADYRRYLMPIRPYSLAFRLLHSGRYGRDGDDPRLLSTSSAPGISSAATASTDSGAARHRSARAAKSFWGIA